MKPATGRTVCLALTLAVLALALSYESVHGQFRGGMPGRPGFPGGMPPGFPNGGMSGRGMGMSGMRGMPGGQFTGMRGGFTGGGNETVWECGKCHYVLGRGPVKPRVVSCPQCGVHFVNGLSPGMAGPGRFRPPFSGAFPPTMPNQPAAPGGNMPPDMQPPGGFPGNQPPGGQPPQLPTEPPPGANPEQPPPAQPAAGEQPPAPADSTTSSGPPASKSSSSKGKWVAIAFAVGIIVVGIAVLAGAALLVVYTQKKSAAPRRKRRRQAEYD